MVKSFYDDSGFTLIDAAVGSLVAMVLLSAMGSLMGSTLRSSRTNNQAQEATAIGMERVEFARSLVWDEVAMPSVDASAPLLDDAGSMLDGNKTGLEADEILVVSSGGLIAPSGTETIDTTIYTVWQYVSDAGVGLRRVVVVVSWTVADATLTHQTSILMSVPVTR